MSTEKENITTPLSATLKELKENVKTATLKTSVPNCSQTERQPISTWVRTFSFCLLLFGSFLVKLETQFEE